MSMQDRSGVLDQLEQELKCPVIAYVTGDRPGLQTQVASEQLVRFPRHLDAIGRCNRLGLVLYTRGGETNLPWPLASFLREMCNELLVLIPFYAHSAGTLLSLAADEITMTRYATLSPIDPTVANAFNPQDPANPANRVPIAVEDVQAFLELARPREGDEETVRTAMRQLGESVHPLALGNVQRSINQIRQLARKMLALRKNAPSDNDAESLVARLTTELYSHAHMVSRREALEIGLPINAPDDTVEGLLLAYYSLLQADLQLLEKFDPAAILRAAGGMSRPAPQPSTPPPGTTLPSQGAGISAGAAGPTSPQVPVRLERAYVETKGTCDAYVTTGAISYQLVAQPGLPPGSAPMQQAVAFEIMTEAWERLA